MSNNEINEENKLAENVAEKGKRGGRPTNPHDRCCRATACNPIFAQDFLENYGNSILSECLDLSTLRQAPTVQLNKELKEVHLDASLVARLLDTANPAEAYLHFEHKSQPSTAAAVQLLAGAARTIHTCWGDAGRQETGFVPPIVLMIIIYNGLDEWVDEMSFQDSYQNLASRLFPYTIKFKLFVINLRRFKYGNLPGELHTQAYVESLLRATDGTFNEHLPGIMRKIAASPLNIYWRQDLAHTIVVYNSWTTQAKPQDIVNAISLAFKGQEGVKMSQTIHKSIIEEGIEIGEARGEAKGEVKGEAKSIVKLLRLRFHHVPPAIENVVLQMTDPTALDSHFEFALRCNSIDEFAASLKWW